MWGVPADDPIFDRINFQQWMWYMHHIAQDDTEQFERERDLVEYLASYIEPEAVSKVIENRSKDDSKKEKEDKEFSQALGKLFGRELNSSATPENEIKYNYDYKYWEHLDLDA